MLPQRSLELNPDALQRLDGKEVADIKLLAQPRYAAVLFILNVGWRVLERLLEEQPWWWFQLLCCALGLDALEEDAAMVVGGDDIGYAGLRNGGLVL